MMKYEKYQQALPLMKRKILSLLNGFENFVIKPILDNSIVLSEPSLYVP